MKVIMYGSPICINCVEVYDILKDRKDVVLDYKIITQSTSLMKEFLSYRDNEPMFRDIKKEGKIGIPFFILEDNKKTFEISDFIKAPKVGNNFCSLDGKGNC